MLISYGPSLSNAQLLASYGLVMPDNSNDRLALGDISWSSAVGHNLLSRWVQVTGGPA